MTSPYQSPTKRLSVEVLTDDGSRSVGEIHLHANTRAPGGYESPLAMMESGDTFFPVAEASGRVALMAKARTVSISYVPSPEPNDAGPPPPARGRASLEVHLSDGSELSGWASIELPKEHARTLDILNGPERFLAVHAGGRVHLVNRAQIRRVYPLD